MSRSPTSTRGNQTDTGAVNGCQYDTTRLRGFALTHVNGSGCHLGAAGDVPIFPHVGEMATSPSADSKDTVYASDFSHADEIAEPGRYRLRLANGSVTDFAATTRAGIGTIRFPQGASPTCFSGPPTRSTAARTPTFPSTRWPGPCRDRC